MLSLKVTDFRPVSQSAQRAIYKLQAVDVLQPVGDEGYIIFHVVDDAPDFLRFVWPPWRQALAYSHVYNNRARSIRQPGIIMHIML